MRIGLILLILLVPIASGAAQQRLSLESVIPAEFDGEYPTRRPPSDSRQRWRAYQHAVLGDAYWRGCGLDRDPKKAVALYLHAALAGEALGMAGLARAHFQGVGTERNLDATLHWLTRAADERLTRAYFEVALHHRRGTIGAANPNKAQEYLAHGIEIATWMASRSSFAREKANPLGAAHMSAGDVFACTEAAPRDLGLAMAFWIRASIEGYPGLWWRMRRLAAHALSGAPLCKAC